MKKKSLAKEFKPVPSNLIYLIILLLTTATKADSCQIRDNYNFRDIYIKSGSTLQKTLYYVQEGTTKIYISLCNPIPDKIFQQYNCEIPKTKKIYLRLEIEYLITNSPIQETRYVCASSIGQNSISKYSYDFKKKQYSFYFVDKKEDDPTILRFPIENQNENLKYTHTNDEYNLYTLKGGIDDILVEDGYLVFGRYPVIEICILVIYLVFSWRFAVLSKVGSCYTSVFICGMSLDFFDCYLVYILGFEIVNFLFQVWHNPTAFIATLVVLFLPFQVACMLKGYKSKGKFVLPLFCLISFVKIGISYAVFTPNLLIGYIAFLFLLILPTFKIKYPQEWIISLAVAYYLYLDFWKIFENCSIYSKAYYLFYNNSKTKRFYRVRKTCLNFLQNNDFLVFAVAGLSFLSPLIAVYRYKFHATSSEFESMFKEELIKQGLFDENDISKEERKKSIQEVYKSFKID